MKLIFTLLTVLLFSTFCKNVEKDKSKLTDKIEQPSDEGFEFDCDSIYKGKGYFIKLHKSEVESEDETQPNTLFTFSQMVDGELHTILSDSLYNGVRDLRFEDFNGDNIEDILIQNISDVRSNWTYYLYLVDTVSNQLKKIKGFEDIKNPRYVPEHDLVVNSVISGKIWTSFYKISGETVRDLDIVIYDNQQDDGSYEKEYEKAIKKIMKKESPKMEKTTAEKENLKGKVKSVHIETAVEDNQNFLKMSFDKEGMLVRKETLYLVFSNYKYDQSDKLTSYTVRVKSSIEKSTYNLEYDEHAFLIRNGNDTYENDNRGNPIGEKGGYGEIKRIYNKNNQVVEDWRYYGESNIIHSWGVDENGKHWERDEIMPSESPHTKYEYNDAGDVVSRRRIDVDKTLLVDEITYKYDDKGNWTERYHTNLFSSESAIGEIVGYKVKRHIKYYKGENN